MTQDADIILVPHTHWDREWYEPFQRFRFMLVEMFDDVLDRLEHDPAFRFTLDGQTAAIEDYLEIRPEHRQRVIDRVAAGQLALGPFHILLDEFLCGGETIMRNLEIGRRGAEALGGAMPIGYLPDMFGHAAQMPQMLRRAGIGHAAMWRGIPGTVDTHAFEWVAPSGDSVRVEYLFDGYGNGLQLIAVPHQMADTARDYRARTAGRFGDDPVLAMVGSDHTSPPADLMNWVRKGGPGMRVATLDEYILAREPATERVATELRSHVIGNILPGVLSIRRPLKVAMAVAERAALTAERLAAQHDAEDFSPYLDMAWRMIVESTAHDSVVGSGVDETVLQVHARLEEAEQIARAISDAVASRVAAPLTDRAHLVLNSLPRDRLMIAEITVAAPQPDSVPRVVTVDDVELPVQPLGEAPTVLGDETIDADRFESIIARIHGRELYGLSIDAVTIGDDEITFTVAEVPRTAYFDLVDVRNRLAAARERNPGRWRVRTIAERRVQLAVQVPVGALGTTSIVATDDAAIPTPIDHPVEVAAADGTIRVDNGVVSVQVGDDGLATITGADGTEVTGVGRVVDGGDRGDSYNYGPPANDTLVDIPSAVEVVIDDTGPLIGGVLVTRWYDWPVGLGDDPDKRSGDTANVEVSTRYRLHAGDAVVRVECSFVNQMSDHRVRFHIPLPEPVEGSAAMGQFAVTERRLESEGGGGEYPLPTYPAYEFVNSGPVTALVTHATEYEVVGDEPHELALTMLRAVGMISVNIHPLRNEPAARELPIPGGQEIGTPIRAEFGLLVAAGGWTASDAVAAGESWTAPPLVRGGGADAAAGLLPPTAGISVTGDHIGLAALRDVDRETVEIRLVNYRTEPGRAEIAGPFRQVVRTDLTGDESDPLESSASGVWHIDLNPAEILTLHAAR